MKKKVEEKSKRRRRRKTEGKSEKEFEKNVVTKEGASWRRMKPPLLIGFFFPQWTEESVTPVAVFDGERGNVTGRVVHTCTKLYVIAFSMVNTFARPTVKSFGPSYIYSLMNNVTKKKKKIKIYD